MPLVLGIDEAGYGPLLGPLVVGATLWRAPPKQATSDFWQQLAPACGRCDEAGDVRLRVDDSKKVYGRKRGLSALERTVLAFARAADLPCDDFHDFLARVALPPTISESALPWYADVRRALPIDPASGFAGAADRLQRVMTAQSLACIGLKAAVLSEDAYNRRADATHNKSAIVVEQVLKLIARALRMLAAGDTLHVHVDRLGGRTNYRPLLQDAFPDFALEERTQSETRSAYALNGADRQVEIDFEIDADQRHMSVALASMLAKYLREVLMEQFNRFWRQYERDLRPTAGYYQDAKRFLRDIAPLTQQAGLQEGRFVRRR